jgi:non-ribosomal peptide synthase protein (TIGR01720 family)
MLLKTVPEKYKTNIDEILIAALTRAFSRWGGGSSIFINREGHGREALFDDVDLSRTVGWFTTLYPVYIGIAGIYKIDEVILSVKEQLRIIPNNGFYFGLLTYLSNDRQLCDRIRSLPKPQISFNYLGQFNQTIPKKLPVKVANFSTGPERSPEALRPHIIDISGSVFDNQLKIQWTYSKNLHTYENLLKLSEFYREELREIIAYCSGIESVHYSPSDFQDADLSRKELEDLMSEIKDDFENE